MNKMIKMLNTNLTEAKNKNIIAHRTYSLVQNLMDVKLSSVDSACSLLDLEELKELHDCMDRIMELISINEKRASERVNQYNNELKKLIMSASEKELSEYNQHLQSMISNLSTIQ